MPKREQTKSVKVGSLSLGGNGTVLIQSMCNIKTSRYEEVSAQINRCAALGADLMRLSVLDMEDAKAFKEIKKRTSIPLVADIHFDYRLALESLENGVDAIRINPGNIGSIEHIKEVVDSCKLHHAPIRIGVNSGSLDPSIYSGDGPIKGEYLLASAKKHIDILESLDFHDIVVSLKGSSVQESVEAYRLASEAFPYPLHLGITEAGPKDIGLIRSSAGLAPLLLDGIGNTIRISLSDEPEEEIKAACRLLHDLGLYPNYPTFISCPTCGRTEVNLIPLVRKVQAYLEENKIAKTVAVMGCIVNGPGEAKHADIGLAGGNGVWLLFKKGKPIKQIKESEAFETLVDEIKKLG